MQNVEQYFSAKHKANIDRQVFWGLMTMAIVSALTYIITH